MMRASWTAALIACVTVQVWAADVTVVPTSVTEHRTKVLLADAAKSVPTSELTLQLKIAGADAKNATAFGRWKITEAADDQGTSLVPKNLFFLQQLTKVSPWMINPSDGSFTVGLNLGPAARQATKIAALKAEFTLLAGGEKKDVRIANLKTLAGKEADDPTLKAAGVAIKFAEAKPGTLAAQGVSCDVSGNADAVLDFKLVDKEGKPLPGNLSWAADDKSQTVHYTYFTTKLDDEAQALFTVAVGQRTLTVPVDLKDVPLP